MSMDTTPDNSEQLFKVPTSRMTITPVMATITTPDLSKKPEDPLPLVDQGPESFLTPDLQKGEEWAVDMSSIYPRTLEPIVEGMVRNIRPLDRAVQCHISMDKCPVPGYYLIKVPTFPFINKMHFAVDSYHPECSGRWKNCTDINPHNYRFTAVITTIDTRPRHIVGTMSMTQAPYPGLHLVFSEDRKLFGYLSSTTENLWDPPSKIGDKYLD